MRWLLAAGVLFIAVFAGTQPIVRARESASISAWHAPRSCIFTQNPVPASKVSLMKGEQIYKARCFGCHGAAGHGNGPDARELRVRPARLSGNRVQEQSDGLLWWKITFGKRPMPGYGFRLSPTDRWHVINYLRTLADNRQNRRTTVGSEKATGSLAAPGREK